MNHTLDLDQVLHYELQLLDTPGPNLSDFYHPELSDPIFYEADEVLKQKEGFLQKIRKFKTTKNHANTIFDILTYILIRVIFTKRSDHSFLQHLKCSLYSPQIQINKIFNADDKNLSNNIMKKILVEFFEVMKYHQGDAEEIFIKYPIVLLLFSYFLRTILHTLKFPAAMNYLIKPSPRAAITQILDYLDVEYYCRKGIFIITEHQIAIYIEPKTEKIFFGDIDSEIKPKSEASFNFEESSVSQENGQYDRREQSMSTPTPQFGQFCEQQISWNRLTHRRKNSDENKKSKNEINEDSGLSSNAIEENVDEEEEQVGKKRKIAKGKGSRRFSENNIQLGFKGQNRPLSPKDENKKRITEEDESLRDSGNPQYFSNNRRQSIKISDNDKRSNIAIDGYDRSPPHSHTNQQPSQENLETKSDHKIQRDSKNNPKIQCEHDSFVTCSCFGIKSKRNQIRSKVYEISINQMGERERWQQQYSRDMGRGDHSFNSNLFEKLYEVVPERNRCQMKRNSSFLFGGPPPVNSSRSNRILYNSPTTIYRAKPKIKVNFTYLNPPPAPITFRKSHIPPPPNPYPPRPSTYYY